MEQCIAFLIAFLSVLCGFPLCYHYPTLPPFPSHNTDDQKHRNKEKISFEIHQSGGWLHVFCFFLVFSNISTLKSNHLLSILLWKDPQLVQLWHTENRMPKWGMLVLIHSCCVNERCENSLDTGKCCGIRVNVNWCGNRRVPPGSRNIIKPPFCKSASNSQFKRASHLVFCCIPLFEE